MDYQLIFFKHPIKKNNEFYIGHGYIRKGLIRVGDELLLNSKKAHACVWVRIEKIINKKKEVSESNYGNEKTIYFTVFSNLDFSGEKANLFSENYIDTFDEKPEILSK